MNTGQKEKAAGLLGRRLSVRKGEEAPTGVDETLNKCLTRRPACCCETRGADSRRAKDPTREEVTPNAALFVFFCGRRGRSAESAERWPISTLLTDIW